jgi:hypothetical protein
MALVGVSQLAAALGRSKGTIRKHANERKIPAAERDTRGNPLFDVDQVRAVYEQGINSLMRRQGAPVQGAMPTPELEDNRARSARTPFARFAAAERWHGRQRPAATARHGAPVPQPTPDTPDRRGRGPAGAARARLDSTRTTGRDQY